MDQEREYIIWLWREIPRSWKTNAVICCIETCYLLLQVWSTIHG